jgi:2-polyprenyl-6-methoxyphenol hydroxylase-like FAD-dependent oxidoreductase
MSAIVLKTMGYNVTVYDARPAEDLHSDGILGITNDNWLQMQDAGVKLARFQLMNTVTNHRTGQTKTSPFQYITWTDLHTALVERATELGAEFVYSVPVKPGEIKTDLTVLATGVGSAREVSTPTYTGWVVIRGLAYQFAGTPWTDVEPADRSSKWSFKVGDVRDGASITMFVPRPRGLMKTTYTAVAPAEVNELPLRWRRLTESVPIWQIAPLSDWTVPEHMTQGATVIRLGDANGQLRPATSMGANLALHEAMSLPRLVQGNARTRNVEWMLLADRQEQTELGQIAGF